MEAPPPGDGGYLADRPGRLAHHRAQAGACAHPAPDRVLKTTAKGHVGGVRHRDVVPHLAARQHLGIAPLGDGDAQVGGFIIVGQLDDLARILQGFVKGGAAELPVGRSDLTVQGKGRLYIRELEAAPGYELDKEYKTVYVQPGKT